MKFSVVIPAYNAEKYISRAIDSILAQSYQPIEIIVVDDGSTDKTNEIAASKSTLVTCLKQQNAGPAKARNYGIREAQGDFVAFLDSDDEWYPHHLERANKVFTTHPTLHWYSAVEVKKYENGKIIQRKLNSKLRGCSIIENYFLAQARYPFISTATTIVRRTTLLELEGFNENMQYGEDMDLWFRLALIHPQLGYSHEVSAIYWQRQESVSHSIERHTRDRFNHLVRLHELAMEKGPEVLRLSTPYIVASIKKLIFYSIMAHDLEVLNDIRKTFDSKISVAYKALILVGLITPKPIVAFSLKYKRLIKKSI